MEDFDPKKHSTDSILFLMLGIIPSKDTALARAEEMFPGIEWNDPDPDGNHLFGSLRLRQFVLDVSLGWERTDFPSINFDSNPEQNYFDLEMIADLLAISHKCGWPVTWFNSAENEYI